MKDKKNSLSHKIVCGISIGMVCSTLLIGGKAVYASSDVSQYQFSFDYGNTDETDAIRKNDTSAAYMYCQNCDGTDSGYSA